MNFYNIKNFLFTIFLKPKIFKSIKVFGGTRSHIKINADGKILTVSGELTFSPIFYADIKSIKNWDPPYEDIALTEIQKQDIIEYISKKSKSAYLKIIFE